MAIAFDRTFHAPYDELLPLSPMVSRLLARNPSPFTFRGTGVYIVSAAQDTPDIAVIDPGPLIPEHMEVLKRAIGGRRITHILVTHTHCDHSPAAQPLKEWSGAPTYGFGPHISGKDDNVQVEEGGDLSFVPDVVVRDGDILEGNGFTFECVYTPGHTSNHMCYGLKEEKALFTGDHVMGWSTTVIAPPDGDMAQYMAGLKKLIARDDRILYPTHGAPIRNPNPFLEAYLDHRLEREAQILACIRNGTSTIPEIVARLYADVDVRLHPAAARSVLAHLVQLEAQGRVRATDGRYLLRH
ncbi:MAG: MBL fold metallo-hydrolase [Alphaproteobacteria bacterium]|jgi:glyoxylase-like metal-dependent hydrolase (beta-lactamase superfamily II)